MDRWIKELVRVSSFSFYHLQPALSSYLKSINLKLAYSHVNESPGPPLKPGPGASSDYGGVDPDHPKKFTFPNENIHSGQWFSSHTMLFIRINYDPVIVGRLKWQNAVFLINSMISDFTVLHNTR